MRKRVLSVIPLSNCWTLSATLGIVLPGSSRMEIIVSLATQIAKPATRIPLPLASPVIRAFIWPGRPASPSVLSDRKGWLEFASSAELASYGSTTNVIRWRVARLIFTRILTRIVRLAPRSFTMCPRSSVCNVILPESIKRRHASLYVDQIISRSVEFAILQLVLLPARLVTAL